MAEDSTDDPLRLLEERYTNGDITLDEYEHRLELLFEFDGDSDADPRIEQLAIRYARGEFDRAGLEQRINQLQSQESHLGAEDVDHFLIEAFGTTERTIHQEFGEVPNAIERLRRRYADGEISDDEYQLKLAILQESEAHRE